MFYINLYLLTVPLFFLLDMLWLGVVARDFYHGNLSHLLADQVDWVAAIIFYLIYIAGILLFAVLPGLAADSVRKTAVAAAGFGFFTYATYEFTNRATLPDWPIKIVLVDILWGITLCTLVGIAAHFIGKKLMVAGGN
ncbi:DUF2177 family protein [Halochromatium roseum]|uniref:DUF2177 family protein n=1 Tax=Halochromatium roseum TaxID=391920 RepID=UPI003084100A